MLGVLDARLEHHDYLAGAEYSIADMATVTWVNALSEFYGAGEKLGLAKFGRVAGWTERILARPLTQKGMTVCRP